MKKMRQNSLVILVVASVLLGDEGLAQEITDLLNGIAEWAEHCEGQVIANHTAADKELFPKSLELAEADLEFYTDVWVKIRAATGEEVIEEAHGQVIRDEIDKFRELFKIWVSTFEKDEYEDEWGLFS